MTLAHGRDHLAIPGPSVIPSRVLGAMHRPAPNIYGGALVDMTESIYRDLATLAGSRHEPLIYIGNGHAAWEASLVNVLSRGDGLLGLVTGRFGLGWAKMAEELGARCDYLDFGTRSGVDAAELEATLRADHAHAIKAVSTVLSDTSSGVRNDIPAIRAAIDAAAHPALLMVDAICSFACEPFDMDASGVDVMVTGCQKGLMTPPGLAFVFVGDRALEARASADLVTPYWDWVPRREPTMLPERFCGTPPTHHLFGLREAIDMLLEESIDKVWLRHETLAEAVWAAVDCWGASDDARIGCHVPDKARRSHAVTTVMTAPGDAQRVRDCCEAATGVTLGIGFAVDDSAPDAVFRIGHMGHLNPPMLLGTLASIEAALLSLGIAHGRGAVDAAADVIARYQESGTR